MGISIYPVPALRKCPPPGFARSFLAGFWTELEMRNPMHLRELVCKFFRNEVSSIFTISSIVSSGEILRLVFHLFVSHKCWLKKFIWGLMWIQSPSIASFTRQNFQSNIDSKIGQGPSMDSTLGTASRHHDKILQCCYFNAKCCRRSLKKVREGVNIKKTSLNHQNYIQCSQFLQCHA